MMRKYHRWLAVLFGAFILWIAATGAIVQFSRMTVAEEPRAEGPREAGPPAAQAAPPKRSPEREFIHFVTELHSGEEFGMTGQIVSLVSGVALVFFALSGLYMYIQMFRGRLRKVDGNGKVRGGRWFW
jgi:uncharacterized iron-regulated membrane protein